MKAGGFLFRLAIVLMMAVSGHAAAQVTDKTVTFAGAAYGGDAASIDKRFPYSRAYEAGLKASGDSPYKRLLAAVNQSPPQHFKLTTGPIDQLKGRDQALVVSLVVNSETVSVERFGAIRKLFVLLRGQVLFFDFKSMTVLRSYPVSFGYVDNLDHEPTRAEVLARVRMVYEGAGDKPGLYTRFASAVSAAQLPDQAPRYLQVTHVDVTPEAAAVLPEYLNATPGAAQTWVADMVSEAISTRVGVPVVPYSKGYAIGNVMSMQVMDGTVFNLKLPQPDYEIDVSLKNFKKIKYSENAVGTAYIYGSYADISIREPLTNATYLNTSLKNGEVKPVPASQTWVDDFPAYYDSVNGLFVKLSESIAGKDTSWVKSAASASDISSQLDKTMGLMKLCK
ncbi:hypothetical protein [Pandoraea pulmonicola]|uniref:Uncharacterized protein n=1 Tax=Pandoraea pulmonicola TaxID=93221 RepID=A0AAJ4ZDZ5_PANPU|nr:hypothetical protein [Pandoraea pulmonicola]AJC20161.1 hypothetical protein RO07_06270 [Pandoraea pulmonicola]SUA91510.1 Uncharacterised protein [Pandoraea pulmonicola]